MRFLSWTSEATHCRFLGGHRFTTPAPNPSSTSVVRTEGYMDAEQLWAMSIVQRDCSLSRRAEPVASDSHPPNHCQAAKAFPALAQCTCPHPTTLCRALSSSSCNPTLAGGDGQRGCVPGGGETERDARAAAHR
jgi:hypothetical protein